MKRLNFLTMELFQSATSEGDPLYFRRYSNKRWEVYDEETGAWYPVSPDKAQGLEIERDQFTDPSNAHQSSGEH